MGVTFSQVVAGEGHLGRLHATGEMVGSIGNGGGKRSRWVSLILELEGFLAFFASSVARVRVSPRHSIAFLSTRAFVRLVLPLSPLLITIILLELLLEYSELNGLMP